MNIPVYTGHNRAHCVGAHGKQSVVNTFLNHRSGKHHCFLLRLLIAACRIFGGIHTHEVEMSVKKTDIDLFCLVVYVERKGLA